jgi:hypothetical protein
MSSLPSRALLQAALAGLLLALLACDSTTGSNPGADAGQTDGPGLPDAATGADRAGGSDARDAIEDAPGSADVASAPDSVTADSAVGPDASLGMCGTTFDGALVKDCAMASGCALVKHNDCCGNVVVAIKSGTQGAFMSAEQAYSACIPGCGLRGCFHADIAEQGGSAGPGQAIVTECQSNRCVSVVRDLASCSTNADCGVGRLCVAFTTNIGPSSSTERHCRDNPCGAQQLSCSCADGLCAGGLLRVCHLTGDQITCDDPRQ